MYQLIEAELKRKGKDFGWLCKRTGINSGIFSMMKKRNGMLNAVYLKKVAKALRKKMEYFVPDEDV